MSPLRVRPARCFFQPLFRWMSATAMAVVLLTGSGGVSAQSIPLVPDPITTPELMKYADLVGLSDQQKVSLLDAHDAYKERYRGFQDRDVKKLEDALWNLATTFIKAGMAGTVQIPPRADFEALVDQYKKVMAGAQAVDRTLFNEMAGSLTDDQVVRLQRAKNSRELANYKDLVTGGAGEFNRGAGVVLTEMLKQVPLDSEEKQQVEPFLPEYETGLLTRTKDVYETIEKAITVVLDAIDSSGIRNMTAEQLMQLEGDEGMRARMETTFDEGSKPFQSAVHQLSQYNLRSYKKVLPMLKPRSAEALRDLYYRRAYREVYNGPGEWRGRYRNALALEGVGDELRSSIQAQLDSFISQDDAIVDPLASQLEKIREYRSFRQMDDSEHGGEEMDQKIHDAALRRESLGKNADQTLDSLLSPELLTALDKQTAKPTDQATALGDAVQTSVSVNAGSGGTSVRVTARADDSRLPTALSLEQLNQFVNVLNLSDADSVQAMYDDYRLTYDELLSKPLTAESAPKGASAESPATDAENDDDHKALTARVQELADLDKRFFDDVALVAADDAQRTRVDWCRSVRQRQAMTGAASGFSGWGDSAAAGLDPVGMLLALNVTAEQIMPVGDVIQGHDQKAVPLATKRLEAAAEVQRRSDAQQRMYRNGERPNQQAQEYIAKKMQEAFATLTRVNRELATLNRETMTQLQASLPADLGTELQLQFNRQSNPEVYSDESSAEKLIEAAFALEDLNPQHREQLAQLSGQFRGEYYAKCDQMVQMQEERNAMVNRAMGGNGFMPNRGDMDREIKLQRLRYEREEVNARTRLRVKLILPPDQASRIPEPLWQENGRRRGWD